MTSTKGAGTAPITDKEWRAILRRQERSGVSIAKFCAAEGLKEGAYYWWKKRLGGGAPATKRSCRTRRPDFVEVQTAKFGGGVRPVGDQWAVELELASGVVVRVRG